MRELAEHRNFEVYERGMDATLDLKWQQIAPWIAPPRPGFTDVIVDEGCGTGMLLKRLGETFSQALVYGRDISPHFIAKSLEATRDLANVIVLKSDIVKPGFRDGSVSTKTFSSVWHELYSYRQYDIRVLDRVLKQSFRELRPGGRLIIRNGLRPNPEPVFMWLENHHCSRKPDPSMLSTRERFVKFVRDFRPIRNVSYGLLDIGIDDAWRVLVSSENAYEFLVKKDYYENWDAEMREVFGIWTTEEYRTHMEQTGFRVLCVDPFLNPWMAQHRFEGKVKLFSWRKKGEPMPFFPTNILAVAEKPK